MEQVLRGVKVRLYPNAHTAQFFEQTFAASRFVYNYFLQVRKTAYQEHKESIGFNQTCKMLTNFKKLPENAWLYDVPSMALVTSLRDLDTAYQNFFRGLKKGEQVGYPQFHSKYGKKQSFRVTSYNAALEHNRLKLPKVGWVPCRGSDDITGHIMNVTVSRSNAGQYYASIIYQTDEVTLTNRGGSVGIDVGLKEFYTDSDGNTVDNPTYLRNIQKKLRREQRRLSRKEKGSHNRKKQVARVAKLHERVANSRNNFLHHQSLQLAVNNEIICVEKLNITGMKNNHRLAQAISDASWYEFFRQLEYKTQERGGVVVKVPTFYPSSQTCSECGYRNPLVKNLSVRAWDCQECGTHHDRDGNAAQNIKQKGMEILQAEREKQAR